MFRYERKYLVPYKMLDSLRARIKPFVRPDIYAGENRYNLPQYIVRSIYFDTPRLECHQEKTEGVELRKKFRIRTYNDLSTDSLAVLEIKKKIENRIQKHRAFSYWVNIPQLLHTADIKRYIIPDPGALDDASRFFFHLKKRRMIPTVLIVYEREAYHGLLDSGVRITFDKNIRSKVYPGLSDMFSGANLNHLFPNHFILEVKYFTQEMPIWAKSIIQEFRLRHEALSKYTIGYDTGSHKTLTQLMP